MVAWIDVVVSVFIMKFKLYIDRNYEFLQTISVIGFQYTAL